MNKDDVLSVEDAGKTAGAPDQKKAATGWRCISTHKPESDPDCVLVCYEDGSVVPAEYLEHHVGGPDDHQTWSPVWPSSTRTVADLERDWPTHWMLLPPPPGEKEADHHEHNPEGMEEALRKIVGDIKDQELFSRVPGFVTAIKNDAIEALSKEADHHG
jgi:hypothetical protein